MVCADKDHYVGGTNKGCAFLNGNPHNKFIIMMMSFVASTKQGTYICSYVLYPHDIGSEHII